MPASANAIPFTACGSDRPVASSSSQPVQSVQCAVSGTVTTPTTSHAQGMSQTSSRGEPSARQRSARTREKWSGITAVSEPPSCLPSSAAESATGLSDDAMAGKKKRKKRGAENP